MQNALRDPSASELSRLRRWRLSTFWVMLLGYVGYYMVRGNLSVAMPVLGREFGYSNTDLAVILTWSEVAYAVGKLTTGPLADQVGGKRIFLLGLLGAILSNLLFPLNPGIVWFTAIWCVCRYFLSMGWGGIIKSIGEWYEPERNGTIMGLISINFQFGSVVASIFTGWLIALGFGWEGLFRIPAYVAIGVFIWAALSSRESPQDVVPGVRFGRNAGTKASLAQLDPVSGRKAPPTMQIVRGLLRIPLFRQVLVFSFFSHLLRSVFLFWTPKFLVDQGMGDVSAAFSSAVFPLLGCLGTVFIGWYTDRFARNGDRAGMMALMLFGLFASLVGISILIPQGESARVAIVVLLGLCGFFLYGPYSMSAGALTLDIAGPAAAGTCTGLIDGTGYLGGAVAAWVAGVMADRLGWSQVFQFVAICALFSVFWTVHMSRSSRRRHARSTAAAVTAILVAVFSVSPSEAWAGDRSKIEIHGHRGARAVRPENTIPAFEAALEAGVDVLEMDLGVTKDGQLVIYHDQKINPVICRGQDGRAAEPRALRELTLKQVRELDCGSVRNPRFPRQQPVPGTRIPTLEEFFSWLAASKNPLAAKVRFNIEMKSEEAEPALAPDPSEFAKLLIESLRKNQMLERTIIQSFDFRTLREARKLEPRAVLSALVEDRPRVSLVEFVKGFGAQIVSPNQDWLSAEDVKAIHAAGMKVVPWTANGPTEWNRLASIGVDGIITDDPAAAMEWRRGAASPRSAGAPGMTSGRVVRVMDGDTIEILLEQGSLKKPLRIRMTGIDAPEKNQPFGEYCRKDLASKVAGKAVSIDVRGQDRYHRTLGVVLGEGGRDINLAQIQSGCAWHYKQYQKQQKPEERVRYAEFEVRAREAHLGLWRDPEPQAPWEFRRSGKKRKRKYR